MLLKVKNVQSLELSCLTGEIIFQAAKGKPFAFRAGYSKLSSVFYSTSIRCLTPLLKEDIGSGVGFAAFCANVHFRLPEFGLPLHCVCVDVG